MAHCIIYNIIMQTKPIDKRHTKKVVVPIQMTEAMRQAALVNSKKLPGCSRPHEGSIGHFVWVAVLEKLEAMGCRFLSEYPEVYKRQRVSSLDRGSII